MIIRIRGKERVVRIEVPESFTLRQLYCKVSENVAEVEGHDFSLSVDPAGDNMVPVADDQTLHQCNFQNGAFLFLHVNKPKDGIKHEEVNSCLALDELDMQLEKTDGRILRKRNPQYCKHGEQGMCSHCQPLEPYDEEYIESKGIKHLSFHSYLRKIGAKANSLEEPSFKVKEGCPRHAPYPAGICSLCQPAAISLNPQPFRFTDHVEFEQPILVERFLAGWRESGYQRFGWLFGRYEAYDEVPLGIKAVVCTIYEPPQDGSVDGARLLDDPEMSKIEAAANLLGLRCIGMIYTDLCDDGTRTGKVECKRNTDTFFLSSTEALFIADQQRKHPNPCKFASSGEFGSKFVTVVATGDESHDIGLFAYQVSLTTMSMLDADIVSATTDPALMMVNPSSNTHYVPEVFYKYRNEYGSQVQTLAKPTFPVDYLIVSLTHGFPRQSNPLFTSNSYFTGNTPEPIAKYLFPLPTGDDSLLKLFCNFKLFAYMFALLPPESSIILASAITKKNPKILKGFLNSEGWHKLNAALGKTTGDRAAPILVDDDMEWTCPHCTFINTSTRDNCEICGLPPK